MGTQAVEQKAKIHQLEGGYLLVDLNRNERFDGYDYIVLDVDGNGQDDFLTDTVVMPEDLAKKITEGTNIKNFSIRDCPVDMLKALIKGNSEQRISVIESSHKHKKLYDENIDAAIRTARGEEYLIVGKDGEFTKFIGKIDEREITNFLIKAVVESQKTCVSLTRHSCTVYTTLYESYKDMASHAPEKNADSQGATDLEKKVDKARKNTEEACNSILSETDISLHGAMMCAAHGDKDCMDRYITLACEKDYACKGEKTTSPEEIIENLTWEEDQNKAQTALFLFSLRNVFTATSSFIQ